MSYWAAHYWAANFFGAFFFGGSSGVTSNAVGLRISLRGGPVYRISRAP